MMMSAWLKTWGKSWGKSWGSIDDRSALGDVEINNYFINRYLDSLRNLKENIELESSQNNNLLSDDTDDSDDNEDTDDEAPIKYLNHSKPPKAIPESFWVDIKAVANDYNLVIKKIIIEIIRIERELFEKRKRDDELSLLLLIS